MKKNKKKKADKQLSLLGSTTKSLRKAGGSLSIGRLSTVVGGLTLATLGLRYLIKRQSLAPGSSTSADAQSAEHRLGELETT